MNKIVKIAIVMAIMMSATFAFGQGTGNGTNNPTDVTTVKMIITHPSMDTWTFEITHRWKDNQGNWGPWETPPPYSAAGGGQTVLYPWTSVDATEYEYLIKVKKANGTRITTTCGTFIIDGSVLNITTWHRCLDI